MGKIADGRGHFTNCPKCDEVVLLVNSDGLMTRLSRHSVPFNHARVLQAYALPLYNVWIGQTGLWVSMWYGGRPDRGRIYIQHLCVVRK